MGYLDNSTIVVDAVLTKEGRRLLAEGQGLDIQYFTLSDSGIDYTLWNPDHPSGSAFYGEAIENLPSLEAIPRGQFYMRNKLITLDKGVTQIPYWTINDSTDMVTINLDDVASNGVWPGTRVTFKINGTDANDRNYQLTIPNASAITSITANNTNDGDIYTGTSITALSNEEAESVAYLQNIESEDAAFYSVTSTGDTFDLRFHKGNISTVIDCTLISLNTGINKTFRLNITAKES